MRYPQAWDLGGHEAVRYLWFDFLTDSHAIVFMVDGADEERLEEAHWELTEMLSDVGVRVPPRLDAGEPSSSRRILLETLAVLRVARRLCVARCGRPVKARK